MRLPLHTVKKPNKTIGEKVEKLDALYIAGVNCLIVQSLWKKVWWFLKATPRIWPRNSTLGIYPKEIRKDRYCMISLI